ncbi:hypothetical protein B0H34DRAFT_359526 [Crassisporium funariophilum]|nr:hypothetical protein B0H34DRAFT_359526 [Crassisporium funariophilum]
MFTHLYRPSLSRPVGPLFARLIRPRPRQLSQLSRVQLASSAVTGTAGGIVVSALVIGAGYAWYQYSYLKNAVDAAQQALSHLEQTREALKAGKVPASQALVFLRQALKDYVSFLPGTSYAVDMAFDKAIELVDTHGDEAKAMTAEAYKKMYDIIQAEGGKRDIHGAIEITKVASELLKDLMTLGLKAGKPVADKLEIEKKFNTAVSAVRDAAASNAPMIKEKYTQAQLQVMDFVAKKTGKTVEVEGTKAAVPDENSSRPETQGPK